MAANRIPPKHSDVFAAFQRFARSLGWQVTISCNPSKTCSKCRGIGLVYVRNGPLDLGPLPDMTYGPCECTKVFYADYRSKK